MNSCSSTPSSGRRPTARKAATRAGGLLYMSERQTEAYLLAREAVRRIQRTSSLISAASQRAPDGGRRAPGDRHQYH
ncbi:MAG TPA: hypothetical protein VFY22_15080 [Hydrogenophaga sp.]|nr:hypothetical protein [Hydrogenophaga sp.]